MLSRTLSRFDQICTLREPEENLSGSDDETQTTNDESHLNDLTYIVRSFCQTFQLPPGTQTTGGSPLPESADKNANMSKEAETLRSPEADAAWFADLERCDQFVLLSPDGSEGRGVDPRLPRPLRNGPGMQVAVGVQSLLSNFNLPQASLQAAVGDGSSRPSIRGTSDISADGGCTESHQGGANRPQ